MKKRVIAFVMCLVLVFSMLPAACLDSVAAAETEVEVELGENIALKATAYADYTNTGTNVKNVNNGILATGSATTWNTWKKGGAEYPAPVWLEWDVDYMVSGMRIIWWADNANITGSEGVTFPKSCEVEYLNDNGEWTKITGMQNEAGAQVDTMGVLYNPSDGNGLNGSNKLWNVVTFPEPVRTKKLRLLIERNGTGDNGIGISEWEVFGGKAPSDLGVGENIALKGQVEAEYSNNGTSPSNVNDGKLAVGASTTWNTWKLNGYTYPCPITIKWDKEYEISSMKLMWWADDIDGPGSSGGGDGVMFPKSCQVQYYDLSQKAWIDAAGMVDETGAMVDALGVKYGTAAEAGEDQTAFTQEKNRYWNGVIFKSKIKTNQLRLLIDRQDGATVNSGIGIGEWEVYGEEAVRNIADGVNIASRAVATAEYSNTDTAPERVNDLSLAGNAATSWNTWKLGGDLTYPQPITLTWDEPYDISSMRVMWWADDLEAGTSSGDGVLYPKSCEAWYFDYDQNDWAQLTDMTNENGEKVSTVGVLGEGTQGNNRVWNGVLFNTPVKTTKLRLYIDRPDGTTERGGIGIGEWEVYGEKVKNEMVSAKISGKNRLVKSEVSSYYGVSVPGELSGTFDYEWSVPEESKDILQIIGGSDQQEAQVKALDTGKGTLHLKLTYKEDDIQTVRETSFEVQIDEITSVDDYITTTMEGREPILPKTVVANGITFDTPTPSLKSSTNPSFDFAETFDSKLVPVEWEPIDPSAYSKAGNVFEVTGKVLNSDLTATAKITVNKKVAAPDENSTVTFENIKLTDEFWLPKQRVNALNSLNAAIYRIGLSSGGEPNFDNAIKRLNGEPYSPFSGLVFQDTDIYKTLEAISYTLSVIQDETEPEITEQKKNLEDTLQRWIEKIEKVQYADGYINTHFTLRAAAYEGGRAPGTHRWRNFNNHEMYNAGHFLESVVAYTRYREGIGDPDYSLYVAGRRFADHVVERFGPEGTRHEVPGHEEIELALVKFAKLVEEYEGAGAGQKYVDTAKLLIDRRGEDYKLRESGYRGYTEGVREYSQDAKPFTEETNAVGHAVRAAYLYTGATDVARLLPDSDPDKTAYMSILDNIWDSVANRKTYITGGIGVASHGEDFGGDYELPNNDSYNEICASIALTNWNQRMNLVHEDTKYVDVMERALYNGVLVGTNLEGNKFYYATKLEIPKKGNVVDGGMYGGVQRQDWFNCACCPPNLMRTIAKLSEYIYTTHKDNVFVNLFIGSDGHVNVDGTRVGLKQETQYPWNGAVKLTVQPEEKKSFTMNIRIPGWVKEQKDKKVTIRVNDTEVTEKAKKGYVAITREWDVNDVITIDMPMEIRKTEANPKVVTNKDKIAIERGPIVYAIEKAGNAQINKETISENEFDPRNFVIPRDARLTADYDADLLKGVMEITGDVTYKKGTETVPAKLQAIPYYASNNRGDSGVYGDGISTRMTVWTAASGTPVARYTVSLDPNGGTVSKTSFDVADGSEIGELPEPERLYHLFQGWYTEKEGGEKVTEETIVTGNMTLYAHWVLNSEVAIRTVTLNPNGGKVTPASLDIESGNAIGALPTPTKTGSVFQGWFTSLEGGKQVQANDIVNENMTIFARWIDQDVVFGASGAQTETDGTYLIAMTGGTSSEGADHAAAYIQGVTATGGSPLGSTRIGCLAFKLLDEWKAMDPDKITATVTMNVSRVNGNLGTAKTKAALFAVDKPLNEITLTNASTYPAKDLDYSATATVFSNEWIAANDTGNKTFDVTDMVKQALKDPDATHAIFRLQTVISGFYVTNQGENAPALIVSEKPAEKEAGKLTIKCDGFTYNGKTKPNPQVVSTTNTGAAVTYKYYSDQACEKEITAPVNAGTYYVKGTAAETETHTSAASAAVKFTIAKAQPTYTDTSEIKLTAKTGQTLNDVKLQLPDGFHFEADLTTPVGEVGKNTHKVSFTPADTDNYEIVTGLKVIIMVTSPEKELGSLTISCAGFVYTGTKKPVPMVVSTTNSDAAVTYRYYSDQACTKEIAAPVNAGTYYVIGIAAETETHMTATSAAVSFTIGKAEGAITIQCVGFVSNGKTKPSPQIIAITGQAAKVSYKYYSDQACKKEISAPVSAGTYYVRATAEETQNYRSAVSNVVKFTIQREIPKKNSSWKVGNYNYKVTKAAAKNGTVELKSPRKKTLKTATIPSTIKINGYTFKVTSISANAFKNNKRLRKVTIGSNVKKIGKSAFSGCKSLRTIYLKTKVLTSVGKSALKGISSKAKIQSPKGKKKAYTKLFKNKGQKKTVKVK
ncbi:MAG: glycoside hydrolase family 127 protein [Lachnospiraceae bacterium]|nr:glycoside hydrolase family 127 protein [Lachnospiraceae bacterium]